jgi:hypothetical protein
MRSLSELYSQLALAVKGLWGELSTKVWRATGSGGGPGADAEPPWRELTCLPPSDGVRSSSTDPELEVID